MTRVLLLACLLSACFGRLLLAEPQLARLQSRHYVLQTDLPKSLAEDLAVRLDAMYEEYDRRFADFKPINPQVRFNVYVFSRRVDYMRLTGNRFPNTAGLFMSGRNILAAFLESQGRDELRRTLQHEAFHQFAHSRIGSELPPWLNEGLAQVFEEGIWSGREYWIGQIPPRRLRQLRRDMAEGRFVPLRRMLSMDQQQWQESMADRIRGNAQYNQAWAMAHFLIYDTDAQGKPRYRARLLRMLQEIRNGMDGQRAFVTAFSDNLDGFEARFREWAQRTEPTPAASQIENMRVLGDMMSLLATREQVPDDLQTLRQRLTETGFQVRYRLGAMEWTSDPDPTVYFRNLQGQLYSPEQLYFERRTGAPIDDVVCRPTDDVAIRLRFHQTGDQIESEILVSRR
jgi:hypothetical protein